MDTLRVHTEIFSDHIDLLAVKFVAARSHTARRIDNGGWFTAAARIHSQEDARWSTPAPGGEEWTVDCGHEAFYERIHRIEEQGKVFFDAKRSRVFCALVREDGWRSQFVRAFTAMSRRVCRRIRAERRKLFVRFSGSRNASRRRAQLGVRLQTRAIMQRWVVGGLAGVETNSGLRGRQSGARVRARVFLSWTCLKILGRGR